ncbi:MAG: hypothetical protein IE928_01835 [Gammaproteobacteria bacterium]|nr:hypothetical protein [Gammaproteobacteria bacterium]
MLTQIQHSLIAQDRRLLGAFLESSFISGIVIAIGWLVSPEDPLLMTTDFPWIWFAPVMVALRYGMIWGLMSVAMLGISALLAVHLFHLSSDFPLAFFLGGLILTMMAGEFADVWHESHYRKDEANLYYEERLTRLTRQYLLLKISHDLLEEQMLSRPGSLRTAIQDLRTKMLSFKGEHVDLFGADVLMGILDQYASIEHAQIYLVEVHEEKQKYNLGQSVAKLGNPSVLINDDQLLQQALEEKSLVHIGKHATGDYQGQLLIAPMITSRNQVLGVLAVDAMPFYAFNEENIHLIQVIVSYYADMLVGNESAQQILSCFNNSADIHFIEELNRLIRVAEKTKVPSYLVVLTFSGEKANILPGQIQELKRAMDFMWMTSIDNQPSLCILMPFASSSGVKGMIMRLKNWLIDRHQGDFDTYRIDVHAIVIVGYDSLVSIEKFFIGKNKQDQVVSV